MPKIIIKVCEEEFDDFLKAENPEEVEKQRKALQIRRELEKLLKAEINKEFLVKTVEAESSKARARSEFADRRRVRWKPFTARRVAI